MSKKFTWIFLISAVVVVFVAFNYQSGQDAVPLSEIFPDEQSFPVDIEYEFVQEDNSGLDAGGSEKVAQGNSEPEAITVSKQNAPAVTGSLDRLSFSPPPAASGKAFNYTVQIASFKERKRAEEALKKIRTKVPSAYISTHDLGSKGVWHRVYAGQFEQRNKAEIALSGIKQNYDSSFIISPKKAE